MERFYDDEGSSRNSVNSVQTRMNDFLQWKTTVDILKNVCFGPCWFLLYAQKTVETFLRISSSFVFHRKK